MSETQLEIAKLGAEIARVMVQAAEANLAEAQSNLDHIKQLAADLCEQAERAEEENRKINDLHVRLKRFGTNVIDAHRAFNGGPPKLAAVPAEPDDQSYMVEPSGTRRP